MHSIVVQNGGINVFISIDFPALASRTITSSPLGRPQIEKSVRLSNSKSGAKSFVPLCPRKVLFAFWGRVDFYHFNDFSPANVNIGASMTHPDRELVPFLASPRLVVRIHSSKRAEN